MRLIAVQCLLLASIAATAATPAAAVSAAADAAAAVRCLLPDWLSSSRTHTLCSCCCTENWRAQLQVGSDVELSSPLVTAAPAAAAADEAAADGAAAAAAPVVIVPDVHNVRWYDAKVVEIDQGKCCCAVHSTCCHAAWS